VTHQEFLERVQALVEAAHKGVAYSTNAEFRETLEALVSEGLLDTADLVQVIVGGVDPYLFLRLASQAFDRLPEDMQFEARNWTIDEWTPLVKEEIKAGSLGDVNQLVTLEKPEPPEPLEAVPPAPEWLSPAETHAYDAARSRAGAYARGLGNIVTGELKDAIAEEWSGEEITKEADPEERQRQLAVIREETANEVATGKDADRLASRMGERTGKWAHDWKRIAETELQGVHNEGRVRDAIEFYGSETQIARLTETGACEHCLRLFRGPDGKPKVFPVDELIANGTNVGKKKRDYLPTIWPVHPRCRCDTIAVPPGMVITSDGRLRRENV
jgi:hypothetical protein